MEKIFDPIRKKLVELTPEEQVRQQVVALLMERMGVPATHIAIEHGFKFNSLQYRADVVVFNRVLAPALLVECKAPSVKIDAVVAAQVARYNRVLDVQFVLMTNGKNSYLFRREGEEFVPCRTLPSYEEICRI